jgi:hypothetical protein
VRPIWARPQSSRAAAAHGGTAAILGVRATADPAPCPYKTRVHRPSYPSHRCALPPTPSPPCASFTATDTMEPSSPPARPRFAGVEPNSRKTEPPEASRGQAGRIPPAPSTASSLERRRPWESEPAAMTFCAEPHKIVPHYRLSLSTWALSNNKELFCRFRRVKPDKSHTTGSLICAKPTRRRDQSTTLHYKKNFTSSTLLQTRFFIHKSKHDQSLNSGNKTSA